MLQDVKETSEVIPEVLEVKVQTEFLKKQLVSLCSLYSFSLRSSYLIEISSCNERPTLLHHVRNVSESKFETKL